jgi:tRNA A-37 threonylcarbamoyl transferase component Bud32
MSVESRVDAPEREPHLAATVHTRERQRRPTGSAPPLPRSIGTTGKAWLGAGIVVLLWLMILAVSEAARDATDRVDTAILEVVANLRAAWLTPIVNRIDRFATGWAVTTVGLGTVVALLVFRRWRHLFTFLGTITVVVVIGSIMYNNYSRARPYGVTAIGRWAGFSFPSPPVVVLAAVLMGVVYTLVVPGRPRQLAKYIVGGVLAVVCLSRMYLGVDHAFDLVLALILGVGIPVIAYRWFTPNTAFPVAYKKGKTAHLDVTGKRGDAIRQAIREQLGLIVVDIKPVGLEGSGGSTPLRLTVEGDPDSYLFAKVYSMTHVRSDRWYKWGRFLLYGRLEDEVPFQNVRRLIEYEDYTFRLLHDVGIPTARSHGIVEITPAREYMLVTDFIDGAIEIGDAEIDVDVIDQGLLIIRHLWDAGLAHRDIKPANLMVRDGKVFLIDAAFLQVRPSPWRQAVDLGNMMLVLALRTDAATVYERALQWFTPDELAEAFAATRGVASPTQLRSQLKRDGRDLLEEFRAMAPSRPSISLQRWSFKRVALFVAVILVAIFAVTQVVSILRPSHDLQINAAPHCETNDVAILMAQSVPSATMVPCVAAVPAGWGAGDVHVERGEGRFVLSSDLYGIRGDEEAEVEVTLRPRGECSVDGATAVPTDEPGTERYERIERIPPGLAGTRYYLFDGGCVTYRLVFSEEASPTLVASVDQAITFQPRELLVEYVDDRSGSDLCGAGVTCRD